MAEETKKSADLLKKEKAKTTKTTTKKATKKPISGIDVDALTGKKKVERVKKATSTKKSTTVNKKESLENKQKESSSESTSKKTSSTRNTSTKKVPTKNTTSKVGTKKVVKKEAPKPVIIEKKVDVSLIKSNPSILQQESKTENVKTDSSKQTTKTVKKEPVKKKVVKTLTKEEKILYKKLNDSFNYIANLTWVIEEKMMDTKSIPDLTLGEIHVVEVVNNNNEKPMSLIAKKLKVTVGSLITCVNRLIQKDYLIRTRDEMDHRVIRLSVTQKAKKALKAHDNFHEEILQGVLDGVTIRDATKVMAQFERTLENYINPKERTYDIKTIKEQSKKSV